MEKKKRKRTTEELLIMKSSPVDSRQIILKTPPRNQSCPCGSGLKYKKCCRNKVYEVVLEPEVAEPVEVEAPNPDVQILDLDS